LKQNTDDYLMGQFQGGDESAFTILVNRHKRDIFNFVLLKIKDRDLASDLTQDVFIKLFNSIEQYQPAGKFKSWLLRIAHNVCIDQFRKKPKAVILSLDDNPDSDNNLSLENRIVDKEANPEIEIEALESRESIQQAMELLPEKQKTALALCQHHGFSYQEIADIEKCPVGTIKSRIHNAMNNVRDYLKEHDLL